ncbi:hypothetical protein TDB9533_00952 [Thalassocella blandensis]|nr:hypothetical protein TDB9533_00952 [Thalassocella blandensis]
MKTSNQYFTSRAFTLIELLVTIMIMGVLLGIATPSMREFSRNQMINGAVTNLSSDLQYARAEAVSRKTPVAICPTTDGASCANTDDWISGWLIMITDASKCPAANECVLRQQDALNATMVLNASTSSAITFDEQGATSASIQFALCLNDSTASADDIYLRTLTLKPSGSRQIRSGASTCNP